MKRVTSIATACVAAVVLMLGSSLGAQDFNTHEKTFLTFSNSVELPGMTLPAGTYTFRLADTQSRNVVQVLSQDEMEMKGQFLFIPAERQEVTGETVITFREAREGTAPAVQYWYYPGEKIGKEFIYPKDQALKIAAATHQSVLATDTDASKGGEAHVFRVEPNGAEAQYDANATASSENTNATTEPAPSTASCVTRSRRRRP